MLLVSSAYLPGVQVISVTGNRHATVVQGQLFPPRLSEQEDRSLVGAYWQSPSKQETGWRIKTWGKNARPEGLGPSTALAM